MADLAVDDPATELLIAQLLEEDLRLITQAEQLEETQLSQALADSTPTALGTHRLIIDLSKSSATHSLSDTTNDDATAALAMLVADVRATSDATYAQALQHSEDTATTAGRLYAQKLSAAEKKLALDAEFARRLQEMDDDEQEDSDNDSIDAERLLGQREIEAILAADPNDKGKKKAKQHSHVVEEQEQEELESLQSGQASIPLMNGRADAEEDSQTIHPLSDSCGICLEPFQLVHSPVNAESQQHATSSSMLPFGLALSCPNAHTYCHDCIGKYICGKIDPEGTGAGNPNAVVFPIKCPECPIAVWKDGITDDVAVRVLSPEVILLWHQQKLLDSMPKLYCPNARCSALVLAHEDIEEPQAECPACQTMICVPCRVLWHEDLSCEEYQALPLDERSPEDQQALQLMKAHNWRRCPECKVIVELLHGCNHITCRCGTHFCFKCGALWDITLYKCTREPSCETWEEDMLLEEREREREAPAQHEPIPPRRELIPPVDLEWDSESEDTEESSEEEDSVIRHPPVARPAQGDLTWMRDPEILCGKHWFTTQMVASLTCLYCDAQLNSVADLQYHLSHTRRHEVFACCGRFFKREEDYDRHRNANMTRSRFGWHQYGIRR